MVIFGTTFGQYFGSWKPKLEHFNSGRVYLGDSQWNRINRFGPVCAGTGKYGLLKKQGRHFGRTICSGNGLKVFRKIEKFEKLNNRKN